MKRFMYFVVLSLSLLATAYVQSQDQPAEPDRQGVVIPLTDTLEFTSAINETDYRISIGLPLSYDSTDDPYPALYVFDPDLSFATITEFVRFLPFVGELPELITVGIGYPESADIDKERQEDFSDEAGFLTVVRDEIIPLIDTTYRTNPADRAIVGFSLGGDFTLFVLANEPTLFKRYIAIAPVGLPLPMIMGRIEEIQERLAGLNLNVFVSEGSGDRTTEGTQFAEFMEEAAIEGVTVTMRIIEPATHASSFHQSIAAGILSVYCGDAAPNVCGLRVRQGE